MSLNPAYIALTPLAPPTSREPMGRGRTHVAFLSCDMLGPLGADPVHQALAIKPNLKAPVTYVQVRLRLVRHLGSVAVGDPAGDLKL